MDQVQHAEEQLIASAHEEQHHLKVEKIVKLRQIIISKSLALYSTCILEVC